MAIAKPNYTQTPNVIFDEMMRDMSEAELKVTLAIVRKTFGWQRGDACYEFSIADLQEMTGMSRPTVIRGVDAGMTRGIIRRVTDDDGTHYYGLIFSDDPEDISKAPWLVKKDCHRKRGKHAAQGGKDSLLDRSGKELLPLQGGKELLPHHDGSGKELLPLRDGSGKELLPPRDGSGNNLSHDVVKNVYQATPVLKKEKESTTEKESKEENNQVGKPTVALSVPVASAVVKVSTPTESADATDNSARSVQLSISNDPAGVLESATPDHSQLATGNPLIPPNDPPMPKDEWSKFTTALLWVCYGHEDMTLLSDNSRRELFAEAKRIAVAGYRIDDLREWFASKWKPLARFKEAGVRPRPFEVRERIPIVRDSQMLRSSYNVDLPSLTDLAAQKTERAKAKAAIRSGDLAWDLMVDRDFVGSSWLEKIQGIKVVDAYELEGERIYEVDGGIHQVWIEDRCKKSIERKLRMTLNQPVRVDFLTEEVRGSKQVSVLGSSVNDVRDDDGHDCDVDLPCPADVSKDERRPEAVFS